MVSLKNKNARSTARCLHLETVQYEKVEEKESVSTENMTASFPPTPVYILQKTERWRGQTGDAGDGDSRQRRWLPLGGAKADAFSGFH